jgi:hypothetical protein
VEVASAAGAGQTWSVGASRSDRSNFGGESEGGLMLGLGGELEKGHAEESEHERNGAFLHW